MDSDLDSLSLTSEEVDAPIEDEIDPKKDDPKYKKRKLNYGAKTTPATRVRQHPPVLSRCEERLCGAWRAKSPLTTHRGNKCCFILSTEGLFPLKAPESVLEISI